MLKKLIETYKNILDKKIENGTFVVLIIAALIVFASLLVNDTNTYLYTKNNILEIDNIQKNNIAEINGIQYKIILEELNKK